MNQTIKSYFALAKSNIHTHEFIVRDLEFFLKSLGINDAIIKLEDNFDLSKDQIKKIENFFTSYLDGLPIDYILNESIFYGFKFFVDSRVLIPRPETELIIDYILDLKLTKSSKIVEVGTGSGCIALTLAMLKPEIKIIASDISNSALEVAEVNKKLHKVSNVSLVHSNWMSFVMKNSLDLVISNPPYLTSSDCHLKNLTHEPLVALTSKNGSQSFIDIAHQARFALKPGGKIIFEHGYLQAGEVAEILQEQDFHSIVSNQDYQGLDRYTYASK